MQSKQHYDSNGYAFPIEVMTPQRAAEYRAMFEVVEAAHTGDVTATRLLMEGANIVLPFVDEIMRLPSILEPVKAILGDDLLVMGSNFFIKEPETPAFVSWHQDLTYWGLDDVSETTAWLALTPATPENGCMRFIPGSHSGAIVDHRDTFDDSNMLSRGQTIAVEVNEADAVDAALLPGEMSLHHGRLFHSSGPNTSPDRRIGLVLRYIKPSMRQVSGQTTSAHLVAGEDHYGHFQLLEPAREVMARSAIEAAQAAIAQREQIGYAGAADRGRRTT
jgi:non-haem Fe2+, alpha-ketoglutarate-dependent halogenase